MGKSPPPCAIPNRSAMGHGLSFDDQARWFIPAATLTNCPILSESRAEERREGKSKDPEDVSLAMLNQGVSTRKARPFSSSTGSGTAFLGPSAQPGLPNEDSSFQSAQSSYLCASLSTAALGALPHRHRHIVRNIPTAYTRISL